MSNLMQPISSCYILPKYTFGTKQPVKQNIVTQNMCQSSVGEKKKKLSRGQKLGLGLLAGTGAVVLLDFIFTKGKHTKSIINNFKAGKPVESKSASNASQTVDNVVSSSGKTKKDYFDDIVELGLEIVDTMT